jgi:hypothetical protein
MGTIMEIAPQAGSAGTLWPESHKTLASCLSLYAASLTRLKAAQPVDLEEVSQQLEAAAEASRNLRSLVNSTLAGAEWRTRDQYDALLVRIEGVLATRSRLMALAEALECGSIVHRRAVRVEQVNQLRLDAINELKCHADSRTDPPWLPGPEPEAWVEWACSLKEPEDSAALETLRKGFRRVDDFVTDLEPGMWVANKERTV